MTRSALQRVQDLVKYARCSLPCHVFVHDTKLHRLPEGGAMPSRFMLEDTAMPCPHSCSHAVWPAHPALPSAPAARHALPLTCVLSSA